MILAYLDAGSGSMIAQAVLAGAAGAAVAGKLAWSRVSAPFGRRRKQQEQPVVPDVPDTPEQGGPEQRDGR